MQRDTIVKLLSNSKCWKICEWIPIRLGSRFSPTRNMKNLNFLKMELSEVSVTNTQMKLFIFEKRFFPSISFLSLLSAGRKHLTDKFLYMVVASATLRKIQKKYEKKFMKPRNRSLTGGISYFPEATTRRIAQAIVERTHRISNQMRVRRSDKQSDNGRVHSQLKQQRLCTTKRRTGRGTAICSRI